MSGQSTSNGIEKEELSIVDIDTIQRKISKMEKSGDQIKFLLWVISNLIEMNKNIYVNDYTDCPWTDIISEFYIDKNPMRRYTMLHEVISGKYLCKDSSCVVHPLLRKVGQTLDSMIYYSLEEAEKAYGENSQYYKKFKRKFTTVNTELVKVFGDVKIIFDSENTERFIRERGHRRSIEKIMHMGKAGVQYTARVGEDVDKSIQLDENVVMPYDTEIQTGKRMFPDIKKSRGGSKSG